MTTNNRFQISETDQKQVRIFAELIRETGIQASLIDQARQTSAAPASPGETVRMYIQDVITTDPMAMYKAGFSLAELLKIARHVQSIEQGVLPSEELAERLRVMYWEYFLDKSQHITRRY